MKKYLKIITACVSFAAAAGLGFLAFGINKDKPAAPTYSTELEAQSKVEITTNPLPSDWADLFEYSPSPSGIDERARIMLRQNPDCIGWVRIKNTRVDYPILMDPGKLPENTPYYGPDSHAANSFYLKRDLDKSHKESGSLFMDYRDKFGSSDELQSENIVIYGHNMLNGTMFGDLRRYRMDYSFYEKAPFVELSTNYQDYDYVIFAFLRTDGAAEADFPYWRMEELDNEKAFNYYVNTCNERALIETGVDVQYGDRILTLQTCGDRYDTERFLIVARRLREGEVAGDMSTIQKTEKYIKEHQTTEAATEKNDKNG